MTYMQEFAKRMKWWTCKHPHMKFIRNLYGDQINQASVSKVYRSEWQCPDCLMRQYRPELHKEVRT